MQEKIIMNIIKIVKKEFMVHHRGFDTPEPLQKILTKTIYDIQMSPLNTMDFNPSKQVRGDLTK